MRTTEIDTRQGTDNQHSFSSGNCLPYTGVPFGMNYFVPQTASDRGNWWFNPRDHTFQGFRLTHQPSPWMGDFSHFTLLPINGEFTNPTLFDGQSSYRPNESDFKPHYMKIKALRYQLTATMIPSMYGGMLSIDYQQTKAGLLLHLPGNFQLTQEDAFTLSGQISNYTECEDKEFTFYFVLHFQFPAKILSEKIRIGKDETILFSFSDIDQQVIRIGTSYIHLEQAKLNLTRELDWQKIDYLENGQKQWEDYLTRIDIEDKDREKQQTFYHNLYRAFLFPQTFYELDQEENPIHYDTLAKEIKAGKLFTNNGFWDTCRTVYPLYSLIAQEKYEEFLEGFLTSYKESGYLPKWLSPDERGTMPGTLIDAVIADAAIKNIRSDLMPEFLDAMLKGATIESKKKNYGRQGIEAYTNDGYVPATYHESINQTLDYCYSDFCISQVAKCLGKQELITYYQQSAKNYKNLFDTSLGFMRAKNIDGQFVEPFISHYWGRDCAEGSPWQSSFAVYHDFAGLIQLFGGKNALIDKLISLCNQEPLFDVGGYGFEIHEMSEMAAIDFGQLAISNQPSFHLPYLFSFAGHPEFAQPLLKQLMTQLFDSSINGYPGDEDNGSMASWYIFSSLGFYPVCPGSGEYIIGMPIFDKAVLHLSNGQTLKITTETNHTQHQFIDKIFLNKQIYRNLFFKHEELMKGGQLHFNLGIVPHPRKYQLENYPFSLSNLE